MAGTFRGHVFNALNQPRAEDRYDGWDLTTQPTMFPFLAEYTNQDTGEKAGGWAMPAMVTEPINALSRLGQNSFTEDGRLGIPNPQNPENQQDMVTSLFSVYGGNALNPAAALPKNSVGMFAGRMAKTADHNALAKAEQMAASGADRGSIWNETGWFQGPDQKWRFEIDDSKSGMTDEFLGSMPKAYNKLGSALDHKALHDAYPSLNDGMFIKHESLPKNTEAHYNPKNNEIVLNSDLSGWEDDALTSVLHETQHAIQSQEGFQNGGNISSEYFDRISPILGRQKQIHARMDGLAALREKLFRKDEEIAAEKPRWFRDDRVERRAANRAEIERVIEENSRLLDELVSANDEFSNAPFSTPEGAVSHYKRIAGEVEARNVQTRMNMSADERRATPPWETQDVPDDQQIVRFLSDTGLPSLPGTAIAGSKDQQDYDLMRFLLEQQF